MSHSHKNGESTKSSDITQITKHCEKVYNEIVFGLINVGIYDIPDEGIRKFKIIMNLYRDHGREFDGEVYLASQDRTLIYRLYNTTKKRSVAYIKGQK